MRRLTILWLLCAVLATSTAFGRDYRPTGRKVLRRAPATSSLRVAAKQLRTRSGFTIRQRRALGLTIPNMVRELRAMKKAGELRGLSRKEVASSLIENMRADRPAAFAHAAAIDEAFWARLLAIIKLILPFLLMLL